MSLYVDEPVKISAIIPHSEGGGMTGRVVECKPKSVYIEFFDGSEGWVSREYVVPVDQDDPVTIKALIDAATDALFAARARRDRNDRERAERHAVDAAYFAAAALNIDDRNKFANQIIHALEIEFGDAI